MTTSSSRVPVQVVKALIELTAEVAPVMSERVYRRIATPLHRVDPAGGALSAQNRLDAVRDRVAVMAARGRVEIGDWLRIQRALARTRDDVAGLAPQLPPLQAMGLQLRVDQYIEAIALLPDPSSAAREGANPFKRRKLRKQQIEAVLALLVQIDQATKRPRGVDPQELDQRRHDLMTRVFQARRLDPAGQAVLTRIDTHLQTLLVRLIAGDLSVDVAYLVKASITDYLPDTLDPFLAMADPHALVGGRPATEVVTEQLGAIEAALAEAAGRPSADDPDHRLLLQGEFLRMRFSDQAAAPFNDL